MLTATISAQEVITVDSTGVAREQIDAMEVAEAPTDSVKPFKRFKAEGVTAVIGDFVVLDSDIDKSYLELQQQGVSIKDITRCQLLGKLMEDKLYAHHAKVDSIVISNAEVNGRTDQQIQYIISEIGSEEKAAKYYKKDKELFETNRTLMLAGEMQRKVVENVEVTPEEVRQFFYSIPEDERPIFSAEVEVAQIVIEPKITDEALTKVTNDLRKLRADVVEDGMSFSGRAVLYSDGPSKSKGGLIEGVTKTSPLAKEFKDMAFSLLEGEVSEPFETEFGWHILYVDKIRGQEVDVRHIIKFPEVSQATIDEAEEEIERIRQSIVDGDIEFAEAARQFSDEKETRENGGQFANPVTLDTRFDLTKMDPTLSAQVYNLAEGEVSRVFTDRDYTGKSKFKILTVTKRFDEHKADYINDYEKIKELALKEKQIRAIEKWQNKKINETYVNVNEDYHDCDFSGDWVKNN